ncbi:MAG: DNA recombination/repair protein RecA, partial [Chlorobium sp.]
MDTMNRENNSEGVDPAKLKQLNLAVDALEKQFGKGTIMRMGDDS